MGNRPITFFDPTGHISVDCYEIGYCGSEVKFDMPSLAQMGITVANSWTVQDRIRIRREAAAVAVTLQGICGDVCSDMTSYEVFREVYVQRTVELEFDGLGAGCEVLNCSQGTAGWLGTDPDASGLMIHEFGHIFDHTITGQWGFGRTTLQLDANLSASLGVFGPWARTNSGYKCNTYPCQQHPLNVAGGDSAGEDFADMFMNFVIDYSRVYVGASHGFSADLAGQARYGWMNSQLTNWVPQIINR